MDMSKEEIPYIKVPLHTIIKLTPTAHSESILVWRGRPLTQRAREKGSGDQPIPIPHPVLLMEYGLFTSCSIKAVSCPQLH